MGVNLISTPYSTCEGAAKAKEVKSANHRPPFTYCYNPNIDALQQEGGGWLDSWVEVCKKTVETKGTVFMVYNQKQAGLLGAGDCKGCFDGEAQQGELKVAMLLGCTIRWVGYE